MATYKVQWWLVCWTVIGINIWGVVLIIMLTSTPATIQQYAKDVEAYALGQCKTEKAKEE